MKSFLRRTKEAAESSVQSGSARRSEVQTGSGSDTIPAFTADELFDLRQLLRYFMAGAVTEFRHDLGVANDLEFRGGAPFYAAHEKSVDSSTVAWRCHDLIWQVHTMLKALDGPTPVAGRAGLTELSPPHRLGGPTSTQRGDLTVSVMGREGKNMAFLGIEAEVARLRREATQTAHPA